MYIFVVNRSQYPAITLFSESFPPVECIDRTGMLIPSGVFRLIVADNRAHPFLSLRLPAPTDPAKTLLIFSDTAYFS